MERPRTFFGVPPKLEIDALMLRDFNRSVSATGRIERQIVWGMFRFLKANGFHVVGVHDGEQLEKVSTPKAAMEVIFNLDDSRVLVQKPGHKSHVILLIAGNGMDIISDWGYTEGDPDGFNAVMDAFLGKL